MPDTVHQADPKNRFVFPKKDVGKQSAHQREKIRARGEQVVDGLRLFIAQSRIITCGIKQVLGHENRQDALHSIETESLCEFVPDDVRNALGHAGLIRIG